MSQLSNQFIKFTQRYDETRNKDAKEMRDIKEENASLRLQIADLIKQIEVHDDKFHKQTAQNTLARIMMQKYKTKQLDESGKKDVDSKNKMPDIQVVKFKSQESKGTGGRVSKSNKRNSLMIPSKLNEQTLDQSSPRNHTR